MGELAAPAPKAADPVVSAANEIESSVERITRQEAAPVAAPEAEEAVEETAEDTIDLSELHAMTDSTGPVSAALDDELPGGLYEDIAAAAVAGKTREGMEEVHFEITLGQPKAEPEPAPAAPAEEPAPKRLASDDHPTQRIDFDHLLFGKDYEIK